jgi:hypothetical protein
MKLEELISNTPYLKTSKKVDLLGVSSISCSGSFDVEFIQSDSDTGFALALSDNDELLNNIEFVATGGELHINSKGNMTIITNNGTQIICSNNSHISKSVSIRAKGKNAQAAFNIDNVCQINNFNTLSGKLKIFVVTQQPDLP